MISRPARKGRLTPNGASVATAALVFAALCNENRLRIMALLDEKGSTKVSSVAMPLGLKVSHASQQLKILREAGLVRLVGPGAYALSDHPVWAAVRSMVVRVDPAPP